MSPSSLGADPLVDCLLYGTLISSVDTVATVAVLKGKVGQSAPLLLRALLLGEAMLNDAVSITLFQTLAQLIGVKVGARPADST